MEQKPAQQKINGMPPGKIPKFHDIGPARKIIAPETIAATTGPIVDGYIYRSKGLDINQPNPEGVAVNFWKNTFENPNPDAFIEIAGRKVPKDLLEFAQNPRRKVPANGKKAMIVLSGGPTSVINATMVAAFKELYENGYEVYVSVDGFRGIFTQNFLKLDKFMFAPSSIGVPNLIHAFCSTGSFFGAVKFKVNQDNAVPIVEVLDNNSIDVVCVIGGDSTAKIANTLTKAADAMPNRKSKLRFVHGGKTADGDIPYYYLTPGQLSATMALIRKINRAWNDVYSTKVLAAIGMQGRSAGYGALGGAYARQLDGDAPHIILLPEKRLVLPEFVDAVAKMLRKYRSGIIVFGEGIQKISGGQLKPVAEIATKKYLGYVPRDASSGEADLSNSMGFVMRYLEEALVKAGVIGKLVDGNVFDKVRNDAMGYDPRQAEPVPMDAYAALLEGEMVAKSAMHGKLDHSSIVLTGEGYGDAFRLSTREVPLKMIATGAVDMNTSALFRLDGGNTLVEAPFYEGYDATDYYTLDYLGPLLGKPDLQPSPRKR